MYSLRGIPISKGIAIGKVLVRHDVTRMVQFNARLDEDQREAEVERYREAVSGVSEEIRTLKENSGASMHKQSVQLIDVYSAMLSEDFFVQSVPQKVLKQGYTADSALVMELENIKREFDKIDNEYIKARFLDIKALVDRVLRKMAGDIDLSAINQPVILAAEEISTAEILHISKEMVLGIATETGGTTSHAALIAESSEIPAVFGIPDLSSYVRKGSTLIVDGYKGVVIIDPDEATVKDYEHIKRAYSAKEKEIFRVINLPGKSIDGVDVNLYSNVSNTMDLNMARRHGADGIGLFRTELAFIAQQKFLNEEEQFELYKEYLLLFQNKEVTIRTLDIGGDKFFSKEMTHRDPNPFLGYRSIRIFLKEVDRFKQQLRAIIRASVFNDKIRILIPMVSSLEEIRRVKAIFKDCINEVKAEGRPFKYNIPLGIMVEVPSAAILSDRFAEEVDFFSIGTNDLVQYTLAVDRNNQRVANFYQPLNPAVLKLISRTIYAANKSGIPVSICGEIARNPLYIRMLLGMGVRNFSINPAYIPLVKSIILKSRIPDAEEIWDNVKDMESVSEIQSFLKQDLKFNLFEVYESYFYDEKKDWKGLKL